MILDAKLILIMLVAALGLAVGAFFYGCHVTDTARDAEALTAQLKAEEDRRVIEAEWRKKLDASQAELAKEKANAAKREADLRSAVELGARKLRIAVERKSVPANPDGLCGGDDASLELSREARQAYFDLRAAIIQDTQTINACQAYVRSIGGAP